MQNRTARLGQIFWGLVLIAVDVRVRTFDILPDFVGYILVALGAAGLVSSSRHFNLARFFSWVLVPVSIAGFFFHGYFGMTLRIAQIALDGAMMWFLLGGLMEIAQGRQRADLVSRAVLCRIAYICLMCVVGLIAIIGRGLPNVAGALGTVTFLVMLCLVAVILHLLYELKRLSAGAAEPVASETPTTA